MAIYTKFGEKLLSESLRVDQNCIFAGDMVKVWATVEGTNRGTAVLVHRPARGQQAGTTRRDSSQFEETRGSLNGLEIPSLDFDSKEIYFAMSPKGQQVILPKEAFDALAHFFAGATSRGTLTFHYRGGEIASIDSFVRKRVSKL